MCMTKNYHPVDNSDLLKHVTPVIPEPLFCMNVTLYTRGIMKPIYFPFTFISEPIAECIKAYFPQFIMYQPSDHGLSPELNKMVADDTAEVRVPIAGDDAKIDAACINYHNWIAVHAGSDISLLKATSEATPFFDPHSSYQLKADIKKNTASRAIDPDFTARVFLRFTQQFDQQNHDIEQNLINHEYKKRAMFNSLTGQTSETGMDSKPTVIPRDQGGYLTAERIKAWVRLLMHDQRVPDIFITSSMAIFDYLVADAPDAATIIDNLRIPYPKEKDTVYTTWQSSLAAYILNPKDEHGAKALPEFPYPSVDRTDKQLTFSLLCIKAKNPLHFFAESLKLDFPQNVIAGNGKSIPEQTYIGYIG